MEPTSSYFFNRYAPVTTAWQAPPKCTEVWDMTSLVFTHYTVLAQEGTSPTTPSKMDLTTVPALWSDPLDERFTACMPEVWTSQFNDGIFFAPAVCPEGWTTALAGSIDGSTIGKLYATGTVALCCSKNYTLHLLRSGAPQRVCTSVVNRPISGPENHGSGAVVTATAGIKAHPAWYVGFEDYEITDLTPRPTEVTGDVEEAATLYIRSHDAVTATAGSPESTAAASSGSSRNRQGGIIGFVVVGLVLVNVLVCG